MKQNSILLFLSVFVLVGCQDSRDYDNSFQLNIYKYVVNQIGIQNYQGCFSPAALDYLAEKVNDQDLKKIVDSLTLLRKSDSKKCRIEYVEQLGLPRGNGYLDSSTVESIRGAILRHYGKSKNEPFDSILDSLTVPLRMSIDTLEFSQFKIARYEKENGYLWGQGMGVIALSRIYFEKNRQQAVLYYEFICGPKCGVGEILFLSRKPIGWKITARENVWVL